MNPYYTSSDYSKTHIIHCVYCNAKARHERVVLAPHITYAQVLDNRHGMGEENWKWYSAYIKEHFQQLSASPDSPYIIQNICTCGCKTYDICQVVPPIDRESYSTYSFTRLYPFTTPDNIDSPNEDMSEECKTIYNEAAQVLPISPRASAALMRLCLQQFLNEQEITGNNINNQIKELVKRGIPEFIQNYIDACRVIGNNGAHPGELNLSDNAELAAAMFPSMNIIVKYLVSEPREARELFDKLPNGAKDAIAKRDGK